MFERYRELCAKAKIDPQMSIKVRLVDEGGQKVSLQCKDAKDVSSVAGAIQTSESNSLSASDENPKDGKPASGRRELSRREAKSFYLAATGRESEILTDEELEGLEE